jgi:LysR family transcriptional regulator for bpeEF and oprC
MLINDGESVIQAAVAGLGIIQAPHVLAACMLDFGKLEPILTDTVSTGKSVWIVYPQKKHLSARVQAFIEWARELFERPFESVCQVAVAPGPIVESFMPKTEKPATRTQ